MDKALETVVDRFLAKDEKFFADNDIMLSTKGQYTILNYRQDAKVRNEHNSWCRALVLDEQGKIVSIPFSRFFNRGEGGALDLGFKACDFIEKLDGCLIGVGFKDGKPIVHTRRTISSHEPDFQLEITTFSGKKASLLKLACEYLKNVKWQEDDHDCCFAFEMIHEATQVVTVYPKDRWGLYLIGGRDLSTFEEMSEGELNGIVEEMNSHPGVSVRRPCIWFFDDENELQSVMLSMPEDFEGFVARERFSTDRRNKIKKPSYLERHHMVDAKKTLRSILPLWLKGEREEIVAYFPDAAEKFDILDKAYADCLKEIRVTVLYWSMNATAYDWSKKDLACSCMMQTEPGWMHQFIFKLYEGPWKDSNVMDMMKSKIKDSNYGWVETILWKFLPQEFEEEVDVPLFPLVKRIYPE